MSDFILLNWPKLLFLAIFIPFILVPLVRVLLFSGKKHQKSMDTLQQYLQRERPQLLARHFSGYTWREPIDYTRLAKDFYKSYEFHMQKVFQEETITLTHRLYRNAQYYGREDTDYKWVYYNQYQIEPVYESSARPLLSGSFYTMNHTYSPMRGAERIADLNVWQHIDREKHPTLSGLVWPDSFPMSIFHEQNGRRLLRVTYWCR